MRSGPATRTAFACVNLTAAFPASGQLLCRDAALQRLFNAGLAAGRIHTRKCGAAHRACWLQSRHARPFSEEAATPGLPATLARFGNRSAVHPRKLLQNQPCAITGSVTFTPAVKAISRIAGFSATKNYGYAVRILWTKKVPCGKARKNGENGLPRHFVRCSLLSKNAKDLC
jgi:hypothetical protein